jgi:hypothetical protein
MSGSILRRFVAGELPMAFPPFPSVFCFACSSPDDDDRCAGDGDGGSRASVSGFFGGKHRTLFFSTILQNAVMLQKNVKKTSRNIWRLFSSVED